MKKCDKQELSAKCAKLIKELKIRVDLQGDWIVLSNDAPVELIRDVALCDSNKLIELLNEH